MRLWMNSRGAKARNRGLLMLKAYVDASGSGDPQWFVMAGYVATSEEWAKFSEDWQKKLDLARLDYFKNE